MLLFLKIPFILFVTCFHCLFHMTKITFGYASLLLLLNHVLHSQSLACLVPLRFFPPLSCYMSYSLFLSLWVLLHGSHFLLYRCPSFLACTHFPCTPWTGYISISLSLPSESNLSLPSMYSVFISWHKSVNTYEPECHKRASNNMAVSGLFLLLIFQGNLLWPFFLSFLSQTAVFFSTLLHCISNCPHFKNGSQLHPLFLYWYSWREKLLKSAFINLSGLIPHQPKGWYRLTY